MGASIFSTVNGLKRLAKRIRRERGIPYHDALDIAAQRGGYENFTHAVRSLSQGGAMGTLELKGLRALHARMRKQGVQKAIFPYKVNDATFTVVFVPVGEPYELSLTANAANVFILLEVKRGYLISRELDNEVYIKLANLLRIDGRSGNKLVPAVFFSELDEYMSGQEVSIREPSPKELMAARPDLPDRELPYFWHWINQDVRKQHVSQKNLRKTCLLLGSEAEAFSLRHNLSSRWTDDEKKAQDWKSFDKKIRPTTSPE